MTGCYKLCVKFPGWDCNATFFQFNSVHALNRAVTRIGTSPHAFS